MSEARCHTEGWDAISSAMSDTAPHASARSCSKSTQNVQERASPDYAPRVHQAERLSAILEEISSDGTVGVADLAGRLDVSAGHDPPGPRAARGAAPAHPDPRRRGLARRPVRAAAALQVGAAPGGEAADRARGRGARDRRRGGRPHRRHDRAPRSARELVDREHLTVVTNALNIASELAIRPNLKLVVTGGVARPESYELVGPAAEQALAVLNLDLACIGVDGIDAVSGCTTHHEVEAATNLALIERARRVVVVADSSKIGLVAFARICPVERVDELITDRGADARALRAIRQAGVSGGDGLRWAISPSCACGTSCRAGRCGPPGRTWRRCPRAARGRASASRPLADRRMGGAGRRPSPRDDGRARHRRRGQPRRHDRRRARGEPRPLRPGASGSVRDVRAAGSVAVRGRATGPRSAPAWPTRPRAARRA